MKDDLEKCVYYSVSRIQRLDEIEKGWGTRGTSGYERLGCYECDGYKKECPSYIPVLYIKDSYKGRNENE